MASLIEALPMPAKVAPGELECDLIVCALGFEERCGAMASHLADSATGGAGLIARYSTNLEDNDRQSGALTEALRQHNFSPQFRDLDSGQFLTSLDDALRERPSQRVLVDISSMSGSLILGVLRVVTSHTPVHLTIGYTRALAYGPTQDAFFKSLAASGEAEGDLDADDAGLAVDHGVSTIRYSIDFQGSHVPGFKDLLLILPGFARDRARAAISFVNPAYLLAPDDHVKWILGLPADPESAWRTDAVVRINAIRRQDVVAQVSESDYRGVIRVMEDLFRPAQFRENITVVPLGTKMQTLGVGLYCLSRPSVRLLIADSDEYLAEAYSRGVGESVTLDFGIVGDLLARLRSVDSLEVRSDD
jgi:hypothetical protein